MPPTIFEVMSRMPSAFLPEKASGVDAVVHFKFSGSEPGEWNAVIQDGRCDVSQGLPHSKPTITVTADSADFVGVVTGDLDATQAVMQGKIKFNGNPDLALRLLGLFGGR